MPRVNLRTSSERPAVIDRAPTRDRADCQMRYRKLL